MALKTIKYLLFFIGIMLHIAIHSQTRIVVQDPKIVKEKFARGNYGEALKNYLLLIEKDPKNEEYNYNIGLCYLNTNINKAKAIPYLEIAAKKNYDVNALYFLGMAYHYAYRFDEAIIAFEKFKTIGKGDSEHLKKVDRLLQYCINAKELIKFPANVTFENLGKNVNSIYPDYLPFIPNDESFIVFNSKRNGGGAIKDVEGDGTYIAGIYVCKIAKGEYTKAKNIGPPINNGSGDEEIVGMSASGDIILVWRYDYDLGYAGVFQSTADKSKNFKKAQVLDKNINSQEQEIFTCISNDGNTLLFSSIRNGGYGGSDLYLTKRLPDGTWGIPVNLGPEINTDMDEDYPNLSPDGKTLYFSSNGHVSMGGFDIFKADWNEESKTWTNIKNLGVPVNTPDDETNLRLSETGRYGYLSALRDEGLGDLDIYKVIFKDIEPKYTVIKGNISSSDTAKKIIFSDILITVTDNNSKELYGNYTPNSNTGNYIMIFPPGNYSIYIDYQYFKSITETINISEKSFVSTEIDKNFILIPEEKTSTEVLPANNTLPLKK